MEIYCIELELSMIEILQAWRNGKKPDSSDLAVLEKWELSDHQRSTAFGITPENVMVNIEARSRLFCQLQQKKIEFPLLFEQLETLWKFWLPLATQLAEHRQRLGRPLVQGILGGQGTGKTTLGKVLTYILSLFHYDTLSLSLDDLYKTYSERQQLQKADPRLIWRGPPGTHDLELGIQVLDQLRQPLPDQTIAIPRFDKSLWQGAGDRISPEFVTGIDIILFEGWFVGCRPINPQLFDSAPVPIITPSDKKFARDMNKQLNGYIHLWEKLDRLLILNPVDYRLSKQWRIQAEHDMIKTGKSGMTDVEISQFVDYFWKALHPELFINSLMKNPEFVDLIIEINPDHSIGNVYQVNL
ncbi:glycerate kinase [Planktothrix agardhii]|uniref:glycerate kinase n=1 Tax=Planktothrix agardhii TaxID=1160 RepID=UPI0020A7C9F6|nr:glycerate kinase [Planktothrix agardhii]CAD5930777.1 putative ATP-dependent kinase TDA10 [Planktothrix agardhii]